MEGIETVGDRAQLLSPESRIISDPVELRRQQQLANFLKTSPASAEKMRVKTLVDLSWVLVFFDAILLCLSIVAASDDSVGEDLISVRVVSVIWVARFVLAVLFGGVACAMTFSNGTCRRNRQKRAANVSRIVLLRYLVWSGWTLLWSTVCMQLWLRMKENGTDERQLMFLHTNGAQSTAIALVLWVAAFAAWDDVHLGEETPKTTSQVTPST